MIDYRYSLEKGSRKFICPRCRKKKFVRYVDVDSGEYLPDEYGRCDRESKCSYHLNPYKDGYANSKQRNSCQISKVSSDKKSIITNKKQKVIKGIIPYEELKGILKGYNVNVFINNLISNTTYPIDQDTIAEIISLYYLGTITKGYRKGSITFPFIDIHYNIRAVQVKQFDDNNHTTGTDFLHSMLEKHYIKNDLPLPYWLKNYLLSEKKVSCLFGEHLLQRYPTNTIALVEAPKTAIIGTVYFGLPKTPNNLIWLAVYNNSSFSYEKIKVLKGRNIIVFPDLSSDGATYKDWLNKSREFEKKLPNTKITVSVLLEKHALNDERRNGLDLADYLLKLDWREFKDSSSQPHEECDMELAELEKIERRLKLMCSKEFS